MSEESGARRSLTDEEQEVLRHALNETFNENNWTNPPADMTSARAILHMVKGVLHGDGRQYGHLTLVELCDLGEKIIAGDVVVGLI